MTAIAMGVENCIRSGGRQPALEGLSKRYRIGRAQQRHDTLYPIADFGFDEAQSHFAALRGQLSAI